MKNLKQAYIFLLGMGCVGLLSGCVKQTKAPTIPSSRITTTSSSSLASKDTKPSTSSSTESNESKVSTSVEQSEKEATEKSQTVPESSSETASNWTIPSGMKSQLLAVGFTEEFLDSLTQEKYETALQRANDKIAATGYGDVGTVFFSLDEMFPGSWTQKPSQDYQDTSSESKAPQKNQATLNLTTEQAINWVKNYEFQQGIGHDGRDEYYKYETKMPENGNLEIDVFLLMDSTNYYMKVSIYQIDQYGHLQLKKNSHNQTYWETVSEEYIP